MAKKPKTELPFDLGLIQQAPPSKQKSLADHVKELEARYKEALRVYRPLPFQERLHTCTSRRAIIRKGNRVGGTIALMVEVARAVLGLDPYDKYPKKGTCVLLGYGEDHIGLVFHRKLFRPGAFFIKKDEKNNWVPCCQDDKGAEPAPPLIPEKYCHDWGWEKKNEYIFNRVVIKNPDTGTEWEVLGRNSNGDPNQLQGIDVHLYVFDEDLAKEAWCEEALLRTTAVGGKIRWGALPQGDNDAMLQFLQEAEDEEGKADATCTLITASMWDNEYTSEAFKNEDIKTLRKYHGEEAAQRRISGRLDLSSRRVYPSFDQYRLSALPDTIPGLVHKRNIYEVLKERGGDPPHEWCRYVSLDPGHQVFAGILWAVPPPDEFGDFKVAYGELFIPQADAQKFGDEMEKAIAQYAVQDFIIDAHGARLTSFDTGQLPRRQYERELRRRGIRAVGSGHGFVTGCDDEKTREMCVRELLRPRDDGTSTVLIVPHAVPHLIQEMTRFKKKIRDTGGRKVVLDDADRSRSGHDTVDAFEYGAAHGLKYVAPPSRVKKASWFDQVMQRRREREERRRSRQHGQRSQGIVLGARGA